MPCSAPAQGETAVRRRDEPRAPAPCRRRFEKRACLLPRARQRTQRDGAGTSVLFLMAVRRLRWRATAPPVAQRRYRAMGEPQSSADNGFAGGRWPRDEVARAAVRPVRDGTVCGRPAGETMRRRPSSTPSPRESEPSVAKSASADATHHSRGRGQVCSLVLAVFSLASRPVSSFCP